MRQVLRILSLVTLVSGLGSQPAFANSINFMGTWADGSVTIPFTVTDAGVIDFQTGPPGTSTDPTLSLFDASGNHIISADDENHPVDGVTLQAHLTQDLAVGNYFLLVSEYYGVFNHVGEGISFSFSDGYNDGSYYIGGSKTLASAQAAALAYVSTGFEQLYAEEPYNVTISSEDGEISGEGTPVPEPTSMLLLGSGLAMAQIRRRRRA